MPGAMRISELSRRSGVPVPTIKFYLRERLLPPGTPTARNQAVYGAAHLGRLRLIRVLTGMGQLSIAAAGEVLQALDDPGVPTAELYGVLARARGVRAPAGEEPTTGLGPAQVDALLERRGWQVKPDGPERDLLAHAAALLDGAELDVLAGTAERLVARQLELLPADTGRATMMARLVTLDAAFDALRRLAVEHHLTSRGQPSAAA
jgi:DNA-binding transcriptional MerR regulator